MKKIIYSFVIMIAAGSLFTSCVTNTEPQGIKDIRQAKADYIESLGKVQQANAELVKAQAATEQAVAAYNQALATLKEIEASVEQAKADTAIAGMKAAAEIAAVKAQQALAEAQQALEVALKKIAAEALSLTADEQKAIAEAVLKYNFAQKLYNTAYADYVKADKALFEEKLNPTKGLSIEDYEAFIAKAEENIATQNAKIATAEGLKEEPQAVKDSIEKWEDVIKSLEVDKVNAQNAKRLYEADSLKEASKLYHAEYEAYMENEPETAEFEFLDEDGNAVKYPLTNGWELDRRFKAYVEDVDAPKYGILVSNNAENILVGQKETRQGWKTVYKTADSTELNKAVELVGEVVSALNRELVVVNDSVKIKGIETLKELADEADSTYKADRDTLEKGLDKYEPLIAANAVLEEKEGDLEDAKAVLAQKVDNLKADSNAVVTAIKGVSAELIVAAEEFAAATNNLMSSTTKFYSKTSDDSARFIAAAVTLGKAKAKYFGVQDSIKLIEVNLEGAEKPYGVPFSELNASGFVQTLNAGNTQGTSLYGGTGYGAYKSSTITELNNKAWYEVSNHSGHYVATDLNHDAFTKVVVNAGVPNFKWEAKIEAKQVLYAGGFYVKESPVAYNMCDWTDTVKWYKNFIGTEATADKKGDFAKVAVKADYEKMAASEAAVQTAIADTVKAFRAVETAKQGVEEAKTAYKEVYKRFWGVSEYSETENDLTNWNEKTFTEPENCVFTFGNWILRNNTIAVILGEIDPESDGNPNASYIFRGNKDVTEFTKKFQAQQIYEIAKNYTAATEQLENINKQYSKIVADVAAKKAEVAEATKDHNAFIKELTGKEGGDLVEKLEPEKNVKDGKWDLGGKQLEWAEKYATNYPAIVKAAKDGVDEIDDQIDEIENFITVLEDCYVDFSNVVNEEHDWSIDGKWGGILTRLDNEIKLAQKSIEKSEKAIAVYEQAIKRIEAGLDAETIELERLQAELNLAVQKLEEASQILAIAKAEYEAVIKKYGVNE